MADTFRMLVTLGSDECSQQRTVMLPAPRTGKPQAYVLATGPAAGPAAHVLLELQRFKSLHMSWLIEDSLISDGGLYLATPVDPLFLLLPVLEKSRNRPAGEAGGGGGGYFCALEQILDDPQHPHLTLLGGAADALLPLVCDTKDAGDCTYYRLNDDLALAWLLLKLAQVKDAVAAALGGLEEDAQLAYVIGFLAEGGLPLYTCKDHTLPPDVQFVGGEYMSEHWSARLASHLNVDLSAVAGSSAAVGSTRPAPSGPDAQAAMSTGDKRLKVDPKAAARKKAEETKAANLAKLAQGTKSITSFFKPRTT